MSRILYWNIQQFGLNKINNPSLKRKQKGSSLNPNQASIARRQYIISTLTANPPDIFVVVETTTGAGAPGTLVNAGGATGALDLLNRIQGAPALGANWRLVPPIIIGQGNLREGISVYYNSANLDFTGPWGWQGGVNPAAPVGGIVPVAYAPPWNNCLPGGVVPGGSPINPGVNMNRLAGQWQFRGPVVGGIAPVLTFPGPLNRTPFLTTFWDAAGGRTIKLLSYHAPPNFGAAANGTNNLSTIQEMTANLGANEVGVIVGDFNVDLFNAYYRGIAYTNLTGVAGYTRHINPTANVWPNKGYVFTHLKTSNQAKPWQTNGYPGYGYTGSNTNFPGYDSIDNILTRYGGGLVPPVNHNMTIVNRVTGSPYNRIAPTPGGAPAGNLVYQTGMNQIIGGANAGLPAALPLPPPAPGGIVPGTIGGLSSFKGWSNYGHIRSTSDHMALIIDV